MKTHLLVPAGDWHYLITFNVRLSLTVNVMFSLLHIRKLNADKVQQQRVKLLGSHEFFYVYGVI